MDNPYISFYLRSNKIHVYTDTLRQIGSPRHICFLIQENGMSIAVAPFKKKGFTSHRVSSNVYAGTAGMVVSSLKLCRIVSDIHHWDSNSSYRIPGFILQEKPAAIFDLDQAEVIEKTC